MSNEDPLHVSIPANLDNVSRLAAWLREATVGILGEDEFVLFEIGVVEIVNNIIEHAFDASAGVLDVTCELSGPRITLQFTDGGAAMPDGMQDTFDNLQGEVELDAESGRGLHIIKQCFDKVAFYRQDGLNKVVVTFLGSAGADLSPA